MQAFIGEVMELVELTPLQMALVGLQGRSGLSVEQRKRLTIAVELVANPSIIFMWVSHSLAPFCLASLSVDAGSVPRGAEDVKSCEGIWGLFSVAGGRPGYEFCRRSVLEVSWNASGMVTLILPG